MMKENNKVTLFIVTVLMALIGAITLMILVAVFLGENISQWNPTAAVGGCFGTGGVIWGSLMAYLSTSNR